MIVEIYEKENDKFYSYHTSVSFVYYERGQLIIESSDALVVGVYDSDYFYYKEIKE